MKGTKGQALFVHQTGECPLVPLVSPSKSLPAKVLEKERDKGTPPVYAREAEEDYEITDWFDGDYSDLKL